MPLPLLQLPSLMHHILCTRWLLGLSPHHNSGRTYYHWLELTHKTCRQPLFHLRTCHNFGRTCFTPRVGIEMEKGKMLITACNPSFMQEIKEGSTPKRRSSGSPATGCQGGNVQRLPKREPDQTPALTEKMSQFSRGSGSGQNLICSSVVSCLVRWLYSLISLLGKVP